MKRMNNNVDRKIRLAAALLLGGSLTVIAGPPFVTDDPEPVEYQHWELYFASLHTQSAEGWSGTAPLFEVNYGVAPNMHLSVFAACHARLEGVADCSGERPLAGLPPAIDPPP